jgi:hypothetical protein
MVCMSFTSNSDSLNLTDSKEKWENQYTLSDWHDISFKKNVDDDDSVYEFLEKWGL